MKKSLITVSCHDDLTASDLVGRYVAALADARDASEMTDRLFTRMHKVERNIAVIFIVDMSGSTKV